MENWFLAYTKPRHEEYVSQRLNEAGIETLNPLISERKLYRRKITQVVSPLFPCYLFLRFTKERDYHVARYTRGLKRILGGDSGPQPVPDSVMNAIRARTEKGVLTIRPAYKAGDGVTVKAGPFEGFDAVFEREMNGSERVSILLKTLGIRLIVDCGLIASR